MKKILKLFVMLFALIINVNVVKALECEDVELFANSEFWVKESGVDMIIEGDDKYYSIYTLKDDHGTAFSAYCRNPNQSGGAENNSNVLFTCVESDSKLLSSNSPAVRKYEAGILAILNEGYSTRNPDYNVLSKNKGYAATNMALRIYELYHPNLNTNDKYAGSILSAHKWYANQLRDTEINALIQQAFGGSREMNDLAVVQGWKFDGKTHDAMNNDIVNETRRLLVLGLKAAIEYGNNGSAVIEGFDQKPIISNSTKINNGTKINETSVKYKFEAKGFKSNYDKSELYIDFNCDDCNQKNIDYKINIYINDGASKVNLSSNVTGIQRVDLMDKDYLNGNGKIEYEIIFSTNASDYYCGDVTYDLNFEWYDESISTEAFNMTSSNCSKSNVNGCQQFYVLYTKDGEPTKKTLDNQSVSLCKIDCDELQNDCDNGNTKACETYNAKCSDCTTHVTTAECSLDEDNIYINEGINSADSCSTESNTNLNVLKCIIDNSDPAGNSYKATVKGFSNVANNDYCSVYCKEDYHFKLPGIQATNSGRYFSLEATVKGNKACYTSEINKTKFNSDIETAKQAVISQFNTYIYEYYLETTEWLDKEESLGYIRRRRTVCKPCGEDRCCSCRSTGGTCINVRNTKKFKYPVFNNNGSWLYKTFEKSFGYTIDAPWCDGTGQCINYVTDFNAYKIDNDIDYEEEAIKLNARINEYISIINEYNKCGGEISYSYDSSLNVTEVDGWIMHYDYNPEITFWYQEKYMDYYANNELDTVGNYDKRGITERFYNNDNLKEPTGNISFNTNWSPTNYITCKVDATAIGGYTCGVYSLKTVNAKYVKQEMSVKAEYITPTQYLNNYPSGGIVVAEEGQEENIDNSRELIHLLPVGIGTRQGVYTYTLEVDNLGEYYNKENSLGRIWGDRKSVVVTALENDEDDSCDTKALQSSTDISDIQNEGVYVCAYLVNIPVCDPDDPKSPGYNKNWQKEGWGGPCDPNGKNPYECDPTDPTSLGYNEYWQEMGWNDACDPGDTTKNYCDPTDPTSPGYNEYWQEMGWNDACDPGDSDHVCDPTDPTSPGYNEYWQEMGWDDACDPGDTTKNYCDPTDPTSLGYNIKWKQQGWKDGCTPDDSCEPPYCVVECEPDCSRTDCPEGECPAECDGCIINNGESNVSYRPVSSGDLNPNDRELGPNWQFDDTDISTAMELKASVTTKEITSTGESIYDIDYDNPDGITDFAMKITLDTNMMNYIKSYNAEEEDNGGYANDTLECYDHKGSDGNTYENVYCYSTFIDGLLTDNKTKDNVKIVGGTRYSTEAERRANTQTSGYWTSWDDEEALNITTEYGIEYRANYDNIGIGPAWK